ncbi:hypothetical protein ACFXAF_26415 [Kitasatospora sp. NPDC059463]|uniref:hypothetical protein n=1 Tax=unclassified Kitasatospora TaxID=2633591 RepID=UPI0036A059AD
MGSKRLSRAAVVAATLVGTLAATAGTANAAWVDYVRVDRCLKPAVTIEDPFRQGDRMLCGGNEGDMTPFYTFDDGTQQYFYIGPNHDVWTTWNKPNGDFGGRVSLGGVATGDIQVLERPGEVDVVVQAMDGGFWYRSRYQNGSWSNGWLPCAPSACHDMRTPPGRPRAVTPDVTAAEGAADAAGPAGPVASGG